MTCLPYDQPLLRALNCIKLKQTTSNMDAILVKTYSMFPKTITKTLTLSGIDPLHYHPTPDSTDDSDRGVDLPQPQVDGTESQLRGALHYHDFIMTNPQHREVAHDCADGSDDDEQYGTVEDHGLAEGVWRRYIRSGLALFNDSQEEINELNKSSSKLT